MDLSRVQDPETLRTAAQLLERENRKLLEKVLARQAEIAALQGQTPDSLQLRLAQLEEQLAQRNHKLFGASSERRPHDGATTAPEKPTRPGHGPRPQPALPLVEVEHSLDDADLVYPQCSGALEAMSGQFEESDEIHVVERRFVIKRHKRKKYRCGCNACIETALGPAKLKPGARYSIDFAIEVAVAKYADHAPLERQVRIMAREGLVTDSQTLWDQIRAALPNGLEFQGRRDRRGACRAPIHRRASIRSSVTSPTFATRAPPTVATTPLRRSS